MNTISNKGLSFRSEYALKYKFIAVFGGNFGIPQKIEFLIDVAERIQEMNEILFILIGEGFYQPIGHSGAAGQFVDLGRRSWVESNAEI